ncbi:MAG: hypothetical protein RML72_10015 [Bacteroidia bacterium]|nr:hypothetical protein [Bacteroidia bacterium]MDW8159192.1 hypothetical protein [Bacteroidia bacterium]
MLAREEVLLLKTIALQNYKKLLFFASLSTLLVALRLHPHFWASEYRSQALLVLPNFKYIRSANFPKEMYKGYGTALRLQLENIVALLKSPQTRQRVAHKYNLLAAYGLENIQDVHQKNKLLQDYYEDKIRVYLEGTAKIELVVYDTDPYRAVKIIQELISIADSFLEKTAARTQIIEAQYQSIQLMQQKIQSLEDSLQIYYRNLGIYPLHKTPENLNKWLLEKSFSQPSFHFAYDKMLGYANEIKRLQKRLAAMYNDYQFRQSEVRSTKLLNVIAPGVVTFEVARPPRLLLCVLAFFLSALTGYSFLVLLSYWKS